MLHQDGLAMDAYAIRMKHFLHDLPSTRVQVIFFDNEVTQETMRCLEIGGRTYYISCNPSGKWVDAYRVDDMNCLFTTCSSTQEPFYNGHLTIGIHGFNNRRWMTSHYCGYTEDPSNPFEYFIDRCMDCTLDLDAHIEPGSLCFNRLRVLGHQTLGHVYKYEPDWLDVIQTLHIAFNQLKETEENEKKLDSRSCSLLTEAMIHMIYEHIVQPVVQHYKQGGIHIQTTLMYDQDSEFQKNLNYMILVYAIPEHFMCKRFYIETSKVFAAIEAYQQEKNGGVHQIPFNRACLQEFRAMGSVHTQSLANIVG